MKTKNLLLAFAALLAATTINAAILTVDNNPTNNAQYSTFAAAFAAANDFDTLLIQPSATNYGSVSISKPLTLIGRGHNQAAGLATVFSQVTIQTSNVTIEGILMTSQLGLGSNNSNLVVRNCRIASLGTVNTASNVLFSGNVITTDISISSGASDILFLNNYFSYASTSSFLVVQSETVVFSNNIFYKNSTSASAANRFFAGNSTGGQYVNNIFYSETAAAMNPEVCLACSFQSNLTFSPAGTLETLPNSTLNNVAPTWNLNGDPNPNFSYSHNYNMLSGAPATGANDGGQVGVHGGGFNFQMNGFPPNIPRVTSTNIATPVVFPNGVVEVEFEAEAGSN